MSEPHAECDVAVVGAGIVGLAVARELLRRQPDARLQVLEASATLGAGQTGHNSGVVHRGVYYRPGSLKAELCTAGAAALAEYCGERGIPVAERGKLIVALEERELPRLDELERRSRANGVPELVRLSGPGLREVEPAATGIAALHSPRTAAVDFLAVARALRDDVVDAGGRVSTGCPVARMEEQGAAVVITHARGRTAAATALVCAGLGGARLARACGLPDEPWIVPFRGNYLRVRAGREDVVRGMIYPVPDPDLPFLGVHLTRHHDGHVGIGPTAVPWPTRGEHWAAFAGPGGRHLARRFWRTGLRELAHALRPAAVVAEAARYVPGLTAADVVAGPAGVRAQAVAADGSLVDDFVIHRTARTLHVRNAPSPAATAALAIAAHVVDEAEGSIRPTAGR